MFYYFFACILLVKLQNRLRLSRYSRSERDRQTSDIIRHRTSSKFEVHYTKGPSGKNQAISIWKMVSEFEYFQKEFGAQIFRKYLPHEYYKSAKFQLQTLSGSWWTRPSFTVISDLTLPLAIRLKKETDIYLYLFVTCYFGNHMGTHDRNAASPRQYHGVCSKKSGSN